MPDHRFEVRIPEELYRQVQEAAERHHRSLNREMVAALESWASANANFAANLALVQPQLEAAREQAVKILNDPSVRQTLDHFSDPAVQQQLQQARRALDELRQYWKH